MQLNVLFIGMEKSEYFRQHQAQSSVSEGSLGKAGKLSIYATFVEESVTIDQRCLRIALWYFYGKTGTLQGRRTMKTLGK